MLISDYIFIIWHNEVPLFFDLTHFRGQGRNPLKIWVHFFGHLKTPKFPSQINWPVWRLFMLWQSLLWNRTFNLNLARHSVVSLQKELKRCRLGAADTWAQFSGKFGLIQIIKSNQSNFKTTYIGFLHFNFLKLLLIGK